MSDDVVFALPDPSYEAYSWVYEDLHAPTAQPPLAFSPITFGGPPRPGAPPRALRVNGYTYMRGGSMAILDEGAPDAPPDAAGKLDAWRGAWKPETDRLLDDWLSFDPRTVAPSEWVALVSTWEREAERVFMGVHALTLFPIIGAARHFIARYARVYGEERHHEALDLLQGFENEGLARAIAFWGLGRTLRADRELLGAARETDMARLRDRLAQSAAGRAFAQQFEAALDRYGMTTGSFAMDRPTWREDWSEPLGQVLAYALHDGESPRTLQERRRARRETLTARLREAAAAGDAGAAELLGLLPNAQQYLPMSEDHNHLCDQRMIAAARQRWLAVGGLLREQGVIAAPDDVFMLELDEIVDTLAKQRFDDRSAVVAERWRQHRRNREATPPPYLGRPPADLPTEVGRLLRDGVRAIDGVEIRGVGASAGTARGTARVIRSLDEAGRLRRGDILVCGVTSQVWTPYFAIVAGVVTNAGGLLSHCAVVAREYGIPCVAGTKTATRVIRDGQRIEIDGAAGVVRVLG